MDVPAADTQRRGRNLSTELMQTLSEEIRGGILKPGEKLPTELAMMSKHGVSRTVVREAMSKLQSAGLVTTRHGIGTFVRNGSAPVRFELEAKSIPTVLDVLAMLEFRISLESEAAALAAARRTDEQLEALRRALDEFQDAQRNGGNGAETDFQFHLRIAEASGNRYFPEVFAHFGMPTIPRTRVTLFKSAEDQAAFISMLSREHEQIYGAILCGDPKLAAKFMRIHLSNSRDRFRKAQEQAAQKA
jgi:GntR family transcriptional repressor for pyruvate dehydrogenase complex